MDEVNGIFELLGAVMISLSCIKLAQDRRIAGLSFYHVTYFTAWGWFNVFFYPSQGLFWSFIGGICVVVMNSLWLVGILYYRYRDA